MVSPAIRMSSATSLGVFCRLAPSTRAIMRSRNVSPGLDVVRTTIRSDRTTVPPVTAQRSPPDSRITGADSPVIADSSTVASPSTTSPSPGMTCPASTTQRSPTCKCADGTSSTVPSARWTKARVCWRLRRKVSAWALPRPSATASAKLANNTVAHNHNVIDPTNRSGLAKNWIVVTTLPISTTNMTGMRTMWRGSSLTNASPRARRKIDRSNIEVPGRVRTFGGRISGGGAAAVPAAGISGSLTPIARARVPARMPHPADRRHPRDRRDRRSRRSRGPRPGPAEQPPGRTPRWWR